MHTVLIVNKLLRYWFLYLFMNFSNDGVEIILIFELQLLMMAATLIRCTFFEYFREPKEYLCFPAWFFREKVVDIFDHELQVDLIFMIIPLPHCYFRLARLKAHLFYLMVLRFKTLFIRFLCSLPPHTSWFHRLTIHLLIAYPCSSCDHLWIFWLIWENYYNPPPQRTYSMGL